MHFRIGRQRWPALVLLGVLLVRGLIPAGFMPVRAATDGSLLIVICTGGGVRVVSVGHDAIDGDPRAPIRGSDECGFAGGNAPEMLPSAQAAIWLPALEEGQNAVWHAAPRTMRMQVPGLGARAPPVAI